MKAGWMKQLNNSHKNVIGETMFAGLVAGAFMAALLKTTEWLTGSKVYVLLLNVDYMPILNRVPLPETVEFMLHLAVSAVFAGVLYYLFWRIPMARHNSTLWTVLVNLFVGLGLYFTTALSPKTPEIADPVAFISWMVAHAVFGLMLALLFRLQQNMRASGS